MRCYAPLLLIVSPSSLSILIGCYKASKGSYVLVKIGLWFGVKRICILTIKEQHVSFLLFSSVYRETLNGVAYFVSLYPLHCSS